MTNFFLNNIPDEGQVLSIEQWARRLQNKRWDLLRSVKKPGVNETTPERESRHRLMHVIIKHIKSNAEWLKRTSEQ